jgi:outer membrane protein assembly factor BamB
MLETFNCPSCHAALDAPDPPRPSVKCPYCGTTVIVPEELLPEEQPPHPGHQHGRQRDSMTAEIDLLVRQGNKIEAVKLFREAFGVGLREAKEAVEAMERRHFGHTMPAEEPAKGGGCRGILILFLILILIGAGAVLLFAQTRSEIQETIGSVAEETASRNRLINGASTLLPGSDGAPSDVVLLVSDPSGDQLKLAYMDGETGSTLWESDAYAGSDTSTEFHVLGPQIYAFSGANLGVYARADGAQLWQVTLSDRLPYRCRTCVALFGSTLALLTLDGHFQGLDTSDGSLIWRRQVSGPGFDGFFDLATHAALVIEPEDGPSRLEVIDPATGDTVRALEPRCDNMPGDPRGPTVNEPAILDRSDQSIIFLFGFFTPSCAQRWNYETGEQLWAAFTDVRAFSGNAPSLNSRNNIFIVTNQTDLYAIDKESGATTLLAEADGYELTPLDWAANVLLMRATRRQGTARDELWAIDTESGETLWRHVPQANEMLEMAQPDAIHVRDQGMWAAQLAPQGVFLVQMRHQEPRLQLETINLLDGGSSGQNEILLNLGSTTPYWIELLGWPSDGLWLKVDSRTLVSVDAATAEITRSWP